MVSTRLCSPARSAATRPCCATSPPISHCGNARCGVRIWVMRWRPAVIRLERLCGRSGVDRQRLLARSRAAVNAASLGWRGKSGDSPRRNTAPPGSTRTAPRRVASPPTRVATPAALRHRPARAVMPTPRAAIGRNDARRSCTRQRHPAARTPSPRECARGAEPSPTITPLPSSPRRTLGSLSPRSPGRRTGLRGSSGSRPSPGPRRPEGTPLAAVRRASGLLRDERRCRDTRSRPCDQRRTIAARAARARRRFPHTCST